MAVNVGFVLTVILFIVLIIFTIFVEKNVQQLEPKPASLSTWSIDLVLDEYPRDVNMENPKDCNVHNLQVCDMRDPLSLVGCKEMLVKCVNFETDTTYMENGEELVIPANNSANEGYALTVGTITENCNPYHGDLVLVAENAEATSYMLICNCKRPGFIGNVNIMGACDQVYICDGKLDDGGNLNRPFENINCECEPRNVSVKFEDGTPVCKTMLVGDAAKLSEDYTHLVPFVSNRLLEISKFNPTVRDNLGKIKHLLNPCTSDLLDPTVASNGTMDYRENTCTFLNEGLPLETPFKFLNRALSSHDNYITLDAGFATSRYKQIRMTSNVDGARTVSSTMAEAKTLRALGDGSNPNTQYVFVNPKNIVFAGDRHQINMTKLPDWGESIIYPHCETEGGAHWNCYYRQLDHYHWYNLGSEICQKKGEGEPWYGANDWKRTERVGILGIDYDRKSKGLKLQQEHICDAPGDANPIGYMISDEMFQDYNAHNRGLVCTADWADFTIHINSVTADPDA